MRLGLGLMVLIVFVIRFRMICVSWVGFVCIR